MYNEVLSSFMFTQTLNWPALQNERAFEGLCHLGLEDVNVRVGRMMGEWCNRVQLELDHDGKEYWVVLREMETVYN
jgi:hypothetical protein